MGVHVEIAKGTKIFEHLGHPVPNNYDYGSIIYLDFVDSGFPARVYLGIDIDYFQNLLHLVPLTVLRKIFSF